MRILPIRSPKMQSLHRERKCVMVSIPYLTADVDTDITDNLSLKMVQQACLQVAGTAGGLP